MKITTIRLPEDIAGRLNEVSAGSDRTKTSIIKAALNSYLPRIELEMAVRREIDQKITTGVGK
jgi:predicted transcriptional regulator